MYRYVPVHTILPDPVTVQVYRIPDDRICSVCVPCISHARVLHTARSRPQSPRAPRGTTLPAAAASDAAAAALRAAPWYPALLVLLFSGRVPLPARATTSILYDAVVPCSASLLAAQPPRLLSESRANSDSGRTTVRAFFRVVPPPVTMGLVTSLRSVATASLFPWSTVLTKNRYELVHTTVQVSTRPFPLEFYTPGQVGTGAYLS